jgi:ornithine carbamoyltransferase
MAVNLRHRSLPSALGLTAEELRYLITLPAELKAATRAGTEQPRRGPCDESLAVRALAGLLTMQEHAARPLRTITWCYLGDGRSGGVDSLMIMGTRLGMEVRICAPYGTWPNAELVTAAYRLARANGGRFLLTDDVDLGVCGSGFLYTAMPLFAGEDRPVWGQHIRLLCPCRAGTRKTGRTERARDWQFQGPHRVPAAPDHAPLTRHPISPSFCRDGLEVAAEISSTWHPVTVNEAENGWHAMKAVLVAALAD